MQKNLQVFREQQAAELLRLQRQHQEAQQTQADSDAELQVSTRSGCVSARCLATAEGAEPGQSTN